jgi:hypothetical protein
MYTDVAPDMIWNLNGFEYRERAVNFLKRFERALCVFSGSVHQLYANYEITPMTEDYSRLVVLPDPYAFHDIFQAISDEAVVKTGLYIMPGECVGREGLVLGQRVNGKLRVSALARGLRKIAEQMPVDEPFLPVLKNTDLRQFGNKMPIIHLHRLRVNELTRLSSFQIHDMQHTIQDKMDQYLMAA